MPHTHFSIPVPQHCQDCEIHCGFASAMMILDWLGAGVSYQPSGSVAPGGSVLMANMSQIMMHRLVGEEAGWACSPVQLRQLINEDADLLPAPGVRAAEAVEGTANKILSRVDGSVADQRPAAVLVRYEVAGGSHWVVVVGRTITDQGVWGYFLRDPWVPSQEWAYTENNRTCFAKIAPPEDIDSTYFTHRRGNSCRCPNWWLGLNRGLKFKPPASIREVWLTAHEIENRIAEGKEGGQSHAVLYGTIPEFKHDILNVMTKWPPPLLVPSVRIKLDFTKSFPPNGSVLHEILESVGLAGLSATSQWRKAMAEGEVNWVQFNEPSGQGVLAFFPAKAARQRVAAWFDADGNLLGAAILDRWPDVRPPAEVAALFRRSGKRMCKASGLEIDLKGATIAAEAKMHWESCRESAVPWWPFYVLNISPAAGDPFVIYIDLAGTVFRTLNRELSAGG